jgi:CRP-like cAMP-binding protein
MNQAYKVQNGHSNYENHKVISNLTNNPGQWGYGKVKSLRTDVPKKQADNEILKSLPGNILNELFPSMEQVYLNTGEYLYKPEDVINYLYFPETAIISDFQILEDGKTLEVAMIGREGVTGIASVFNSHSSPNWLQVSIPGKALRIDSKTFRQEFLNYPALQRLIYGYVNHYIAQISQKVICNSHHSVEERLCCWLLMIADRCGRNHLPLTQEQIAGFLGVHRPSVTLITQSLREKGIIDYLRGRISILDKTKLEFTACDCYSTTRVM